MDKDGMLLKIFVCASIGSLIWLGSFVLLSGFFEVQTQTKPETVPVPSQNLELPVVYSSGFTVIAVRGEQDEITDFYLQYADFLRDSLVFVRVPTDTQIELSAGAYEVLRVHRPEMPKLFMLSELLSLAREELFCMAAEEAMGGLLGVRPKACYLLPEELFSELTGKSDAGLQFLAPESMVDTVLTVQHRAVTDRTEKEALIYTESYCDIKNVFYQVLPGEAQTSGYRPDSDAVSEMAQRFEAGMFELK